MIKIKTKAIIFDYGNTLVHEPFFNVLNLKMKDFQKALKRFGYKFNRREILKNWEEADEKVNYPHLSHFVQELPIVEKFLIKLGLKEKRSTLAKKLLQIYRRGRKKLYQNEPRKKELKRTLRKLRKTGKKLAIFSDGRKIDVKEAMKIYGISRYFKFILTSEEIGVEKPNQVVFKILLKRLKESSSNVVHVGDNLSKDIEGAKRVGLKAILYIPPKKYRRSVPWRNYLKKITIKPDAIIKKISDLEKIII